MKDLSELKRHVAQKEFSSLVNRILLKTGWTERELGAKFGTSQSSVNRWRQPDGRGFLPSLVVRKALEALARELGVSLE